jgi:hypothetical protein
MPGRPGVQLRLGDAAWIMCADPLLAAGGAVCCNSPTSTKTPGLALCEYQRERSTFAAARRRCEAMPRVEVIDVPTWADVYADVWTGADLLGADEHMSMCHLQSWTPPTEQCPLNKDFHWLDHACTVQVQVDIDGFVNIVHTGDTSTQVNIHANSPLRYFPFFEADSRNKFSVRWTDGRSPDVAANCGDSPDCTPLSTSHGDSCVCDTAVSDAPVFTDAASIPPREEVLARLKIGAPAPGVFDAGTYELCRTAACDAVADVQVWTRDAGQLDARAIFGVVSKTRDVFLFNRESLVTFSGFSFRNPPQFNKLGPNTRGTDAAHETDAIIDAMFYHDNMAPFIAKTLTQRFTVRATRG